MDPEQILREITERTTVRAAIAGGEPRWNVLTDTVFAIRHPNHGPIAAGDAALAAEWNEIRERIVEPELMTGPHGLDGPLDRTGARDGARISAIAHCTRGLRPRDRSVNEPRWMVVHCTGGSPAQHSKRSEFRRPALEFALDVYLAGRDDAVWPHYVIDFNGAVHAVCDELMRGRHAGWAKIGGGAFWTDGGWTPADWWTAAWTPARTPNDLLASGAASPNTHSIGVELLIHEQRYTHDQYRGLARLIADLAARYPAMRPTRAPQGGVLVGHEDVDPRGGPDGRANAGGGWDPGAHRRDPFFSWERVWRELEKLGS